MNTTFSTISENMNPIAPDMSYRLNPFMNKGSQFRTYSIAASIKSPVIDSYTAAFDPAKDIQIRDVKCLEDIWGFIIQPQKTTKCGAPTVKVERPTYSSRGRK
jgi:hypothetical protein